MHNIMHQAAPTSWNHVLLNQQLRSWRRAWNNQQSVSKCCSWRERWSFLHPETQLSCIFYRMCDIMRQQPFWSLDYEGQLTRHNLVQRLSDYFGSDLLILSGVGVVSLLIFQSNASHLLKLVSYDNDTEVAIQVVSQKIAQEAKQLYPQNNRCRSFIHRI